ncbi:MAG: HYR domain-containing protein, partial [Fluviicola sp.]|nr:HYR domain-containing protein [Fluviicola sp.]
QTAGLPSGSLFPIGITTNTFTATDISGNSSSCSFTITVSDNQPPVVGALPDILADCSASPASPTASDNCSGTVTGTTATPFPITTQGTTVVVWTFIDGVGNSVTANQNVIIQDVTSPTITCPANISTVSTSGSGAVVSYFLPAVSDNCGTPTLTQIAGLPSGSTFPIGTTTNTYQVTDAVGLTTTCSFTVTVTSVPPSIVCPGNITVANDAGVCGAAVTFAATETTGIPASTITYSHAPGSVFPVGTTTVTATANNGYGTSVCSFTITVQDSEAPNATCQPYTVTLDASGNASITAANVDGGSTDNCMITSLAVSPNTFNCTNIGANTVTLTVIDQSGNTSTCTTTVTVQDNIFPVANCQTYTVMLDASGNATITAANVNSGSSDNCSIASLAVSPNTFNCTNIGANTVTLTVTDQSGNTSTCTTTVTVLDNIAPSVITQPFTVYLDAAGNASITAANVNNGSTDNCSIATLTVLPNTFNCSNVGTNTVTLTVVDVNGNSSFNTSIVTVIDTIAPDFVSTPSTINLPSSSGVCGNTVSYTLPTFTDNCSVTMTQTDGTGLTSGSVFPVGTTLQTFTLTDASGLTATYTFTITIVDNEAPVISNCPSNIIASASATSCGNTVSWTAPTVLDNCSAVTMTSTHNPGDVFVVGLTTITYTAVDAAGNNSTCTFTVTVNDNLPPVAPTLATITGECSASVTAPTATDNCSGIITGTTIDPLNYSAQGTYSITWVFDDGNGNTSTTTQLVVVDDTTPPVIPVISAITGECSATATAPSTTDNCTGSITGTTLDPLTYTAQGTHIITWSFDDGNGNVSTATQSIIVNDITPPTIVAAADTTVNANNLGCSALDLLLASPITSDNCSVVSVTNDAPNPLPFGATTVTWTATDINGNIATAQQLVTVTSNITGIIDTTTCVSYLAPDGAIYSATGVYSATIPSFLGCDSVITINLSILNPSTSTLDVEACDSYIAPDGAVYTTSGVYTAILTNAIGCDSVITINLNIHTLNLTVGIQQNGTELVAEETGVTYQWYNCTSGMVVPGANNQTYVPVLTAFYSVILSDTVCTDTSDCVTISLDITIPEVISPNADGKNDQFEIIGIEDYPQNHVTVYNRWGQVVFEAAGYKNEWDGTNQSNGAISTNELPVGTYFYVIDLGQSVNANAGQIYKGYVYLTR